MWSVITSPEISFAQCIACVFYHAYFRIEYFDELADEKPAAAGLESSGSDEKPKVDKTAFSLKNVVLTGVNFYLDEFSNSQRKSTSSATDSPQVSLVSHTI